MSVLELYSDITTYIVIVPIIWGLFNLKSIKEANLILALLIVSLIVEVGSKVAAEFYTDRLYRIGLIYSIFEISFVTYFFVKVSDFKYKKYVLSINFLLSLYLLIIYIFNIGGIDIPYAISSTFEIIIASMYMLSNTKNILRNWKFTILFAIFQYNILAISVFSIVDFIEKHQEYVSYYYALHSTANLNLYILITIGLFQCKKHFLKASSLSL